MIPSQIQSLKFCGFNVTFKWSWKVIKAILFCDIQETLINSLKKNYSCLHWPVPSAMSIWHYRCRQEVTILQKLKNATLGNINRFKTLIRKNLCVSSTFLHSYLMLHWNSMSRTISFSKLNAYSICECIKPFKTLRCL